MTLCLGVQVDLRVVVSKRAVLSFVYEFGPHPRPGSLEDAAVAEPKVRTLIVQYLTPQDACAVPRPIR